MSINTEQLAPLTTASISGLTVDSISAFDQYTAYGAQALTIDTSQIYTTTISTIPAQGFRNTATYTNTVDDDVIFSKVKRKKYIVAGNYQEYKFFINKKKIDPKDFVYVSNADMLRGQKDIHGYYIGSWRNREDIDSIKLSIEIANIE